MDKPPKAKWETLITSLLYSNFLERRWEEISRNYLLLTIHYDETVKSICPCCEVILNALSNYKLWIYCKKTEKSWVSAWNMVQDQTWLYKMFAVLKMFWVRWSFWQEFLKCEHSKKILSPVKLFSMLALVSLMKYMQSFCKTISKTALIFSDNNMLQNIN